MPHITLEYTSNIIERNDMQHLFKKVHPMLAERLPTNIENCKSRAIELKNFYLGTGDKDSALINVTLEIMSGRTADLREKVVAEFMTILKTHFQQSLQKLKLQISIALRELPPQYEKVTS